MTGSIIKREASPQDASNAFDTRTSRSGRALKAPIMYEPAVTASPKGKRSTKKETSVICIKCHRGSSPSNNMIVFCDGCNDTWHQKCHDPPINDHVVQVPDAEWHCHKCRPVQLSPVPEKAPILKKRKGFIHPRLQPKAKGETSREPLCVGSQYSMDEKRAYLAHLAHAELVEFVLRVANTHPTFPIFPMDMEDYFSPSSVPPRFKHTNRLNHSHYASVADRVVLPTSDTSGPKRHHEAEGGDEVPAKRARTTSAPESNSAAQIAHSTSPGAEPAAEPNANRGFSEHFEAPIRETQQENGRISVSSTQSSTSSAISELPQAGLAAIKDHRVYPRAGNGFTMALNSGDLDILQDEADCPTFSHKLRPFIKKVQFETISKAVQ
ncbi:hypothetical protein N7490_004052 [Penicillium lividum]|nr:hypothetical protein N7490_004052 [Penicillium lividum]